MKAGSEFEHLAADMIRGDRALAICVLDEIASLFLNSEPGTAKLMLRNLVNGTIGFEKLAKKTGKPSKSLHRMLSARGNPTIDNLALILDAVRKHLRVEFRVKCVNSAKSASRRRSKAA